MGFKERLKEARLSNNMTQEQVAELIGVAKSTFTGYEKGNSEPNMLTVSKIMNVLKVDANFLWQDDTNFPMQVSYEEIKHIEKYRDLDSYGKETVSYILDRESERVESLKRRDERISELEKKNILAKEHAKGSQYIDEDMPDHLIPRAARNDHEDEPEEFEKMQRDLLKLKRPDSNT